jgi:hypothetical protein
VGGRSPIARIFGGRIINLSGLKRREYFWPAERPPPLPNTIQFNADLVYNNPIPVVKLTESQISIGVCTEYIQCKFVQNIYSVSFYILVAKKKNTAQST